LRIGWMIAPPELLAKATMCKQFSDAHTSTFAQATAAQYLRAGRMPATLDRVRAVYAERARTMSQLLQAQLGSAFQFTPPGGGLFVWGQLTGQGPSGAQTLQDASELARRAIDQGVAFVPGAPFYAHNPNPAALRLSFATVGLDKIQEGVGRLAKALLG
jgi:DNA-binding transcriptional MocR family regulator